MIPNRDLRPELIPRHRAVELGDASRTSPHQRAWSRIWRFAVSFVPSQHDGPPSRLADRREELARLFWDTKGQPGPELLPRVDALLDGIHAEIAGGRPRPPGGPGPAEPGIGDPVPDSPGHRQWLGWHAEVADRQALYDEVAARLRGEPLVTGLYLYPPYYPVLEPFPPLQRFALGLEQDEYQRIVIPIVKELGDPRFPLIKPGNPRRLQA